jgi:hypothetical protein
VEEQVALREYRYLRWFVAELAAKIVTPPRERSTANELTATRPMNRRQWIVALFVLVAAALFALA